MDKTTRIEISWGTLWQVLAFIVITILFFAARGVWGVLFAAIVISLGLDPAVSFLEKRGVHRILGTILVFVITAGILSTAAYLIVPTFIQEASGFLTQFSNIVSRIFGINIPESAIEGISENLNRVLGFITSTGQTISGAISGVIRNAVYVIATFIITFYLSVEKNGPERFMRAVLPDPYEKSVIMVFNRFSGKVRRWLLTQIGLSLMVGTIVALGMWILGVPYALTLGVIAAIFELVPVIGPILSGLAAFLIAITLSPMLGLYVVIFFFVVEQLENNVFIPLVVSKSMRIHPVVVLVALLAGSQVAGFVGIILAVPVAILAQEIFTYLSEQKTARKGMI